MTSQKPGVHGVVFYQDVVPHAIISSKYQDASPLRYRYQEQSYHSNPHACNAAAGIEIV